MNQRKVNAVLIIDMQYDFCNPNGALFVEGAAEDCQRLSKWIRDNKGEIDEVVATLDSHSVLDIAHPSFWQDKNGNAPGPFTLISLADIESGTWTPKFFTKTVIEYIRELESQGEYKHCVWPEHCLIGTKGHAIEDNVAAALTEWTRQGRFNLKYVTKGTHPLTEHFGAFAAQVPVPNSPETQINQGLLKALSEYANVFLAGEAKSHCVATTLKQIIKYAPALASRLVILEDTMSPVKGFETLADPIYADAKAKGVRFTTTDKVKLETFTGVTV